MEIVETIADFIQQLSFNKIPPEVIQRSKYQLISMLGAIYAGRHFGGMDSWIRAVREIPGKVKLLPYNISSSPEAVAVTHSILSMALDYDDYLLAAHAGHSSCNVPLSFGIHLGSTGEEFLEAQICSNELAGRLGISIMLSAQAGQLCVNSHLISTIASLCKLYDLDPSRISQLINAGFYLRFDPSIPGFMGADSKLLSAALPIHCGIQIFKYGSLESHPNANSLSEFIRNRGIGFAGAFQGLGKCWVSHTLSYKILPGCGFISAALDGIQQMMAHGIPLDEIRSIRIGLSLPGAIAESWQRGYWRPSPISLNFSAALSCAGMLVMGSLDPENLSQDKLSRKWDRILELSSRIKVYHDPWLSYRLLENWVDCLGMKPELTRAIPSLLKIKGKASLISPKLVFYGLKLLPKIRRFRLDDEGMRRFEFRFGAKIEFEFKDGKMLREVRLVPKGAKGWDWEDTKRLVELKFLREASSILGYDGARAALEELLDLEKLEISELSILRS